MIRSFLVLLLFGCSQLQESYESVKSSLFGSVYDSVTEIEYPIEFKAAHRFLKDKKFARAEEAVQAYLRRRTDIYWYGHAYLLLAEAQEEQNHNNDAMKSYKQAIKYGAGYDSPIMATAMYRLSWLYERQQKYRKLLVLLLDLQKHLKPADFFVKEIESPARIANVYYVLGHWDKAVAYRKGAKKGVKNLSAQQKEVLGPKLYRAKNYLALQALKVTPKTNLKTAKKLQMVQADLLDVGEMAPQNMAAQAYENLEQEYGRLWKQLSVQEKFDTPVEQDQVNRKKLNKATTFMDLTAELKASRRPGEIIKNVNETLAFFKQLSNYEQKVRDYAHDLQIGLRAAEKRNNPKEKSAVPRKERPLKVPTRINKEFLQKEDKNL